MSVGQRIKKLRGSMSQIDFAKQFGVTSSTISGIEAGKSIPSVELATKICELYDCSLDWLLRGIDKDIEIKAQDSEYKTKYIELLERHTKLLESELAYKENKIRGQLPAPAKTPH